jgi:hypothetical protein
MNKTKKAFVFTLCLVALFVSACGDPAKGSSETEEPVWTRFTTFGEMGAWLADQVENSVLTPYYVALDGINLRPLTDDTGNDEVGFDVLFSEFKGRYVSLNLDACTGATALYSRNYRAGEASIPDRDKIVSVRLPAIATRVSWYVFKDCSSLKTVTFPVGILSIGEHTFQNCVSLTEVNLPASLIRIEQSAFQGCSSLRKVVFRSKEIPLLEGTDVFSGASPDLIFQVPKQLYTAYQRKLGIYGAVQAIDGL